MLDVSQAVQGTADGWAYLRALQGDASVIARRQDGADSVPALCAVCKGAGFVRRDVPLGHPDFGRAVECRCRARQKALDYAERIYRESNLGRAVGMEHMTFDRFDPAQAVPAPDFPPAALWRSNPHFRDYLEQEWADMAAAVEAAGGLQAHLAQTLSLCRTWAHEPRTTWLVLYGMVPGCGKSHLAAAIVQERLSRGEPALFLTVPGLINWLKRGFDGELENFNTRWSKVVNYPMLVLDDLGTERMTEWVRETLFELVNTRHMTGLPTVVTTNVPPDLLAEDRISSRIQEGAYAEDGAVRRSIVRMIHAGDYRKRRRRAA